MWWGFWLLAALAAAWLTFDYFYWSIRLPQDRVLTNKQGDVYKRQVGGGGLIQWAGVHLPSDK